MGRRPMSSKLSKVFLRTAESCPVLVQESHDHPALLPTCYNFLCMRISQGDKLLEGQVIQLEDGTTAYIHQVTVQKEPLSFEDGQPVQLEDGSMAYIHRTPKEGYDPSALEAVQLEDGSTAYIHHPVAVPSDGAILAVQTEVGLEGLAAEDDEGFSADTVVALEQYTSKVSSLDDR
ncbi:TPA: zinc finger protein 76 (expressed in testis)-like, partial [Bos taurus]